MSTIDGLNNSASSLLAALQDRLAAENQNGDAGNDKGAKAAAVAPKPAAAPGGGASFSTPFAATLLSELVQMQGQSTGPSGDASPIAATAEGQAAAPSALSPRGQALFAALDTDGNGQVSQSELEAAFASAGADASTADAVFKKLDTNGDGAVSQDELGSAQPHHHHHHHHPAAAETADASAAQNPLVNLLEPNAAGDASAAGPAPASAA